MPGPWLRNCSPQEKERLRLALEEARARLRLGVCGLSGLDDLRRSMLASLNGLRRLVIRCSDCEGAAVDGYTLRREREEVVLCQSLLTGPQDRVNAVLFHELVHACGGDELDGEGLECHCFRGDGATEPGGSDYRLFRELPVRNGHHVGNYLMWHPRTGQVFVRGPADQPGEALRVRFVQSARSAR